jgi:hypothetical protein
MMETVFLGFLMVIVPAIPAVIGLWFMARGK